MPAETRHYSIDTDTGSDTLLSVKTNDDDGVLKHLAADDDSGADRGAKVEALLEEGKEYWISVLTRFAQGDDPILSIS